MNNRLINTKVAGGGGGCTDIVDNYDPFGDSSGLALYQLNGNANDVSGNYNGTATSVTYGTGVFGQAGVFNGVNSKITATSPVQGNTDATVSFWVNTPTVGSSLQISGQAADNARNPFTVQWYDSAAAGKMTFSIWRCFDNQIWYQTGYLSDFDYDYQPNTWYHIVMTYTASNKSVRNYVNGTQIGGAPTLSLLTNANTGTENVWGSYNNLSSEYLDASLDQVRYFNKVLTPLEVEALYTEELCICDGTVDTLDILGDGSCIATYQLDGNANDLSGNYSGTPTAVSYGVGEFDLAGVFNGSSSEITFTKFTTLTNNSTYSTWFKTNISSPYNTTQTFLKDQTSNNDKFAIGTTNVSGGSKLIFTRINGVDAQYNTSTSIDDGNWHHIVFVQKPSSMEFYIDGVLDATVAASYTRGLYFNTIGRDSVYGTLNGSLDQVRIFNKALSAGEVTTLYNETACTPAPLDPCVDVFSDESGLALYQLNGTAFDLDRKYDGAANDVTYAAGQFNQAAVFNGSSSYIKASNSLYTGLPLADYSVSAWFKINAYGDQYPTIFASHTGGITLPPYLWISASILRLHGYTYNDYTNTLSTGVWYNVIMVNSGTTTELYLNGAIQTPTSRNTYTTTTGQFFDLGGVDQYPTTTSFDGSIDQVRIFNKALSPSEVTTLYTNDASCG